VQPKRVLIIDDEEHIREIAMLSFELVNWDVLSAATGRAGVTAAVAARIDVILLDVMMPELDGPGTVALLNADERTRSIPVIFLTAKVQASDRRRYRELGVQGVIAKPFDPVMLPFRVVEILRGTAVEPSF
jgi:two-component system alkaline phosphatase synthesis response regulator PhoP